MCRACAEREPFVSVFDADSTNLHEDAALKARRQGEKNPYLELKLGESLEYGTGVWRLRLQRVDRDANWYDKVVTDQDTGSPIHECHERLTEHQGRGSAKGKRPPSGAA